VPSAGEKHGLSEHENDGEPASKRRKGPLAQTEPPLKLRGKTEPPSKAGTPSKFRTMTAGDDPKIQCNRPMDDTTIPLPLLHQIFGDFVDDCGSFDPGPKENAFVSNLSRMANYFESEKKRQLCFNSAFAEYYGIRLTSEAIGDTDRTTDGHAYVTATSPYITIFVEGKNEFVGNSADPRFQVILYYREYVLSLYKEGHARGTCLPVILMTYCGA
jgi:hypothetical protein